MKIKFDETEALKMLQSKWQLESFEDVRQWDSKARIIIIEMDEFIASKESLMNETLTKKLELEKNIKSTPFLLRSFQLGKIWGANKSQKELATDEKEINRVLELKQQLGQWIDATPDTQREANDIITELKLSKKQIDINKKELQLQIKQINSDTKQKLNRIENRVLFTSPKLKRLQKIKAEKKQDKAVSPLEESLMDLEAQELEVDKLILWYEKIKYS